MQINGNPKPFLTGNRSQIDKLSQALLQKTQQLAQGAPGGPEQGAPDPGPSPDPDQGVNILM